ncbi:hypothetical protein ACFQZQ_03010 [Lysobacter koreensis]|uniref:Uncharacterized protein n=1 Tax=Lysobacter koreensis TaxID=266122 RepID=A0ABW2YLA9_9GAMM
MAADLRVIEGGGQPEPDAESIAIAERAAAKLVATVKAGGTFWLLTEGDEMEVAYIGGALELSAVVEEVGREMKLSALGLGE